MNSQASQSGSSVAVVVWNIKLKMQVSTEALEFKL